jgi:hypothetical protein
MIALMQSIGKAHYIKKICNLFYPSGIITRCSGIITRCACHSIIEHHTMLFVFFCGFLTGTIFCIMMRKIILAGSHRNHLIAGQFYWAEHTFGPIEDDERLGAVQPALFWGWKDGQEQWVCLGIDGVSDWPMKWVGKAILPPPS